MRRLRESRRHFQQNGVSRPNLSGVQQSNVEFQSTLMKVVATIVRRDQEARIDENSIKLHARRRASAFRKDNGRIQATNQRGRR